MKIFLGIIIALGIAYFLIHWLMFGVIKYQTSHGEHTGFVTSIEQNGIFWKTWTAYVKTNTTSSQEDAYCVIDPDVISTLQADAADQQHVDLFYSDWLKKGIQNCNGEDAVITSVKPIAN